jgi:hypothetical protein
MVNTFISYKIIVNIHTTKQTRSLICLYSLWAEISTKRRPMDPLIFIFIFLNKKHVLLSFLNKPKGIAETDKGYKTPLHL